MHTDPQHVTALYTVELGKRHVVDTVTITGNKYFSTQLIAQRLSVRPASFLDRDGAFSQQLVDSGCRQHQGALPEQRLQRGQRSPPNLRIAIPATGKASGRSPTSRSTYVIDEGTQRRIGKYDIEGATAEQLNDFRPYLNAQVGQPYSAVNINQDRDLVQTYYLSKGYDNAQVSLFQQTEPDHPDEVDFTMKMVAGKQFFVRKVIVSGVNRTRPSRGAAAGPAAPRRPAQSNGPAADAAQAL